MDLPDTYQDAEYTAKMIISKDRHTFTVKIKSDLPMSDSDIILAIEDWLRNNLMEGYWKVHEVSQ